MHTRINKVLGMYPPVLWGSVGSGYSSETVTETEDPSVGAAVPVRMTFGAGQRLGKARLSYRNILTRNKGMMAEGAVLSQMIQAASGSVRTRLS